MENDVGVTAASGAQGSLEIEGPEVLSPGPYSAWAAVPDRPAPPRRRRPRHLGAPPGGGGQRSVGPGRSAKGHARTGSQSQHRPGKRPATGAHPTASAGKGTAGKTLKATVPDVLRARRLLISLLNSEQTMSTGHGHLAKVAANTQAGWPTNAKTTSGNWPTTVSWSAMQGQTNADHLERRATLRALLGGVAQPLAVPVVTADADGRPAMREMAINHFNIPGKPIHPSINTTHPEESKPAS